MRYIWGRIGGEMTLENTTVSHGEMKTEEEKMSQLLGRTPVS